MNSLLRTQRGFYGLSKQHQSVRYNTHVSQPWILHKTKRGCKSVSLAISPTRFHSSIHHSPIISALTISTTSWMPKYYAILLPNGASSSSIYYPSASTSYSGAIRHFHLTQNLREQSSSKVEETIKKIQENEKAKETQKSTDIVKAPPAKKSLKQRVWQEILHYYHGFRLLFIDINIARKLLWKVLNGKTLTRREYTLLIRTTGDVFRLVPFSVFIIVPFMEFLLPVFIKFFPGMLPSTFETDKDKETKARNNLKVKLEMAKFLQKTLDEMDLQNKEHRSEEAKEFSEFFQKIRTSGERATPEEILKFSKLFEDEITLDSLSRQQLTAICKVLEVSTIGTNNLLRFQLRMKLRSLAADDRMIQKEGIDSLTLGELQAASRTRGMRSYGLSEQQLRSQIKEWIDLSLNEKVPASLLLMSRAMMLPEDVPATEKLIASISVLSDSAAIQTKAAIGEREGKIDNKTKIDILRDEERKIKEDLEELKEVEKSIETAEILLDNAPVILPIDSRSEDSPPISTEDIEIVADALEEVSKSKRTLLVEKEEIKDLKEEIADYKEDVEELQLISNKSDTGKLLKESKASKMLLKKVDSMISKLDKTLNELEKKEETLKENLNELQQLEMVQSEETDSSESVRIDEVMNMIRKMQKVSNEAKLEQINKMLGKIDADQDGQLKVDDVLKIIETIGKENVNLNEKQIDEIIELISKEERLENEDKIEKALTKSLEERQVAKEKAEELKMESTKTLTDEVEQQVDPMKMETKTKIPSKIDERINKSVIQNADETVARQKDKILPPPIVGSDAPKTSQLPTNNNTNPKDKML